MKKLLHILPRIVILLFISCEPDKPDTIDASSKIVITTDETVTPISANSVNASGSILDDGGFDVKQSGICWSTQENPTINDNNQNSGTKIGEFTVAISGLSSNQDYYIRAFAKHSWGNPVYGNQVSFKTAPEILPPKVTTTQISNVTSNSAQSGGNVTDDGGAAVTARGVCWNTLRDPTISNHVAYDIKGGTGSFTSNLTDLSPNTEYHVRAFAINSKDINYGEDIMFTTAPGLVTDVDGNNYEIIKIGNQWWMAENLKTARYADGTIIPLVEDNTDWINTNTGAMCYYNNDPTYKAIYGGIYNWYCTISSHKLCPSGWHVPSDAEWEVLIRTLGPSDAGYKLKEAGDAHWTSGNVADNSSGFTALPGGSRHYADGQFNYLQTNGYWWSSTDSATIKAFNRNLWYGERGVSRDCLNQKNGFNIRCIQD